ncbi:YesL family protein [Streptomyces shenzhenensis]|uniref:YesL family protein n=1 Tax=Streptomyces shenzhenensis TaxID=943815 RepID=UPI0015F03555|nr:YesL family protein [Streptomyces shenzhenensis]
MAHTTAEPRPGGRTGIPVPRWTVFTGNLAVLNLCWLAVSLPLVTALPAAVAMQRAMHRWLDEDETRVAAAFVQEFRLALRGWLPLGAGVLAFTGSGWIALSFWLAVPRPVVAVPALAMLLPLLVLGAACLAVLLEAAGTHPAARPRELPGPVLTALLRAPARVGALLVLSATWLALVTTLPSLGIAFGASLPAFLAHRQLHTATRPGQAPPADVSAPHPRDSQDPA